MCQQKSTRSKNRWCFPNKLHLNWTTKTTKQQHWQNEAPSHFWYDLWKPVTCRKWWNCKIKEINIIILMFFFIFYSLWTSVTFDTSIRGDPSNKLWKENNSNFHMIPITQNINFAPCDRFSQITSHLCTCNWACTYCFSLSWLNC